MSAFNPNSHKLTAAEWQEIAKDRNEETGAQFTIIGGVVLGLFAAAAASPITGLLVAGYFACKAWQDTQAANRNEEAIDSYGCVAHLLKASDLKDYARQVGDDTAAAEITFALENGYRVTNAAIEFAESRGVDVDALMAPQLPAAKRTEASEAETTDTPAIETTATPVQDTAKKSDATATDGASPALCDPSRISEAGRFAWAKDLLHFPAVLIWGAQGSGKTSFAAWLLHQRIAAGHSAWVCDPHKEYGQWKGLKVVGAGMDYEACDRAMIAFASTVKREYKTRSEQANYQPQRETVLVEEFTNWANRCENAGEFFAASLSDLRKIQKGVIFVSHDRSLVALGNAKGFGKARDNGLLELQLEATIDPTTGDPKPAMKGKLKLPGKAAIEVEISPEMCGSMDFTQAIGVEAASAIATDEQQRLRDRLEGLYRSESPSESPSNLPDSPSTFPEGAEARKEPSENLEGAGSTQEVGFPASEDWRKYFPEAAPEVEEVIFRAYFSALEGGKGKQDFIAEFLRGGNGGRRYQAASKYLDYLVERFGDGGK